MTSIYHSESNRPLDVPDGTKPTDAVAALVTRKQFGRSARVVRFQGVALKQGRWITGYAVVEFPNPASNDRGITEPFTVYTDRDAKDEHTATFEFGGAE